MTDTRVTRLVRIRDLTNGAVFRSGMYQAWGDMTALDVEHQVDGDCTSVVVLDESGTQRHVQMRSHYPVEVVVQP